jgi:isorenieratene synthase
MAVTPADDQPYPAVVLGGGLAGLTAAAHLAASGVAPLVLDADQAWPGGRLAGGEPLTFSYQGRCWQFRDEHGVHAVWGGYLNLRATLERFTNTRLQPSYGEEWINRWGREVRRIEAGNAVRSRYIPAPFHYLQLLFNPSIWATISPWDFLSLPGFLASILLTVGVDPIREQKAWDGLLLKDYFTGWTPNLKATFRGLGVNLLAASEENIPLTAFIAALRFYTVLRRDSWQMSYYPADGHTSVIAPLAAAIASAGGRLLPGTTAIRLRRALHGWDILCEDAYGHSRAVPARHIILALHPSGASRLLLGSEDTQAQAAGLVFPGSAASAVARMWFSKAPREGVQGGMLTGDFVPDNFFWLHRLYDDYRAWHAATGGSAVEVHFYPGQAQAHHSDSHLLVLATAEIQTAFPELRGSFVYGTLRRNSRVHTVFRVPTASSLHVVTPWDSIVACGDWIGAETPSLWMERAATTGIMAANEVLACHHLPRYPLQQPPPAEPLVRALEAVVRLGRRAFRRLRGR